MNLLLLLMIKHFICDFPLQAHPWMYRNKGTYGHLGGLIHAWIHMVGTAIVVYICAPAQIAMVMGVIDFFAHYHIDYAKMKIGATFNLKPDNSEWFWILLGFDQFLHFLTYYFIARMV